MTDTAVDIIDLLTGIKPGSSLDSTRARRPVTREHAQKSYLALFAPVSVEEASLSERFALATFVASLHGETTIAAFYAEQLTGVEGGATLLDAVKAAAAQGAAKGPYGQYPAGPLSPENLAGLSYTLPSDLRAVLGGRLSAALEHAHLLVFHLRDASPAELGKLAQAGWSTTGIVTLSQLVSFLAFQIRVVAGLKVLAAA
jgi:CMD domain protein